MICQTCQERRSASANNAQWPILNAWSEQRQWPINGILSDISSYEWKDILTAAFENDVNPRIAPGLHGGMVMLGRRTSHYGKKRFGEWLDWLNAESHHAGIKVPAPANVSEF